MKHLSLAHDAVAGSRCDDRAPDEGAIFASLYAGCYSDLLRYCRARTPPGVDPEDVVQDAFIDAWLAWDSYSPERSFWSWVVTIARRRCADRWRQDWRVRRMQDRESRQVADATRTPAHEPSEVVEILEEAGLALSAFRGVAVNHQRVLHQHHVEGLSYEQIAQSEGVTVESVRGQLRRARDALRRGFDGLAGGLPAIVSLAILRRSKWRMTVAAGRWQQRVLPSGDPGASRLAQLLAALVASSGLAAAPPPPAVSAGHGATAPVHQAAPLERAVDPPVGRTARVTTRPGERPSRAVPSVPAVDQGPIVVNDIVASPGFARDRTLFATSAPPADCAQVCGPLMRSTDAGRSWRRLPAVGFLGGRVLLPPGYPGDPRIFAAGPTGLQASYDGGSTFVSVSPVGGPAALMLDFSAADPVVLLGAAPGWQYDDRTRATRPLAMVPAPTTRTGSLTFGVTRDRTGAQTVVVGGTDAASVATVSACRGGVCRDALVLSDLTGVPTLLMPTDSHGSAIAWTSSGIDRIDLDEESIAAVRLPAVGRVVAVQRTAEALFAAIAAAGESPRLFRSTDDGRTWEPVAIDDSLAPGLAALVGTGDKTLLIARPAAVGGGVACSVDDGSSWTWPCSA